MEEKNIPTVYDPQSFEKKWYQFWERNQLFHAEVERDKKPFSIVIPPPNVTGQLHMGHALDNTLQDIPNSLAQNARLQYALDAGIRSCRDCYAD